MGAAAAKLRPRSMHSVPPHRTAHRKSQPLPCGRRQKPKALLEWRLRLHAAPAYKQRLACSGICPASCCTSGRGALPALHTHTP